MTRWPLGWLDLETCDQGVSAQNVPVVPEPSPNRGVEGRRSQFEMLMPSCSVWRQMRRMGSGCVEECGRTLERHLRRSVQRARGIGSRQHVA